jgi:hypothetical protein
MPMITARTSRIQGQIGVEVEAVGATEVEPVGLVAGGLVVLAACVWVGDEVGVEDEVEVVVVVGDFVGGDVVFVDVVVVVDVELEVWTGDELAVGASVVGAVVGALVVRVTMGVREGTVGSVNDRDALGRFEPPPQEEAMTSAVAKTAGENFPDVLARRRIRIPVTSLRPRRSTTRPLPSDLTQPSAEQAWLLEHRG